jgi:hypothetical protein
VRQHLLRLLNVLDRLEEHDGVAGLAVGVHEAALEAHARSRVLQARVLVGVRIGVHSRHARGAPRQHVGAVALAARHVHDLEAAAAVGDPLVNRQVAAEPVVLLRHVRQRALAREGKRGHALGLVALEVFQAGHYRIPRRAG